MQTVLSNLKAIRTFIFDVDGVFTDGRFVVIESGELLRSMHAKDGLAVKKALEAGFQVIIITGGNSQGVKIRFEGLGVKHVFLGIHDKLACYNDLVQSGQIDSQQCLYMGDDLPDIPVMKQVHVAVCPKDAASDVLEHADWVVQRMVVRHVFEK